MRMPLGRRQDAKTVPTGSLSLRMTSRPSAIASIRAASRVRRSRKTAVAPETLASAKSSRLAARIVACEPRIAFAMAARARFFWAAGASASARAALRAARPMSRIVASSLDSTLPWLPTALSGAFMALIRLTYIQRFLPRSAGWGEAAGGRGLTHSNPQQVIGPSDNSRNLAQLAGVQTPEFPRQSQREGAMRLPIDRQSSPLPKRFPVGARYVVEGRGGEDGHLRVVSRYVVLPGGQRINVPSDLGQPPGLSARASRHKRARNRVRPSRMAAKKIMRGVGTTRQHAN